MADAKRLAPAKGAPTPADSQSLQSPEGAGMGTHSSPFIVDKPALVITVSGGNGQTLIHVSMEEAEDMAPSHIALFTARGDGIHVPQCLHEGGIHLYVSIGYGEVKVSFRGYADEDKVISNSNFFSLRPLFGSGMYGPPTGFSCGMFPQAYIKGKFICLGS